MAKQEIGIQLTLSGNQQLEAGLQRSGKQLNEFGQTAAQTANNMRMIPAQMTDVVTSLASGQDPLTVLIQQGGQLKDSFGGIGPAIKAVSGYLVGLINPYTLAATAAGLLGYAHYKGEQEASAFRKALELSGNMAGTSVGQLQAMAASMNELGITTGKAAEVMAQLASTGQIGSQDLQKFTATAVAMEKTLGVPIADTIKAFAELGKEPVEASRRLNEAHHYLTAAVYEQIQALVEQGRTLEAGQLAQQTYEAAMNQSTKNMVQDIGAVEKAWNGVSGAAKKAWDNMLNIGRQASLEQRLQTMQQDLQNLNIQAPNAPENSLIGREKARIAEQIAGLQALTDDQRKATAAEAERQRIQEAGSKAFDALSKTQDRGLSKQQQLNKALVEYRRNIEALRLANPNSEALSPAAVAAGERALREQYKETPKAKDGTYDRLIARVQDFMALQQAELQSTEKLSAGQRMAADVAQELERAGSKLTAQQRQRITADMQAALAVENKVRADTEAKKAAEAYGKALDQTRARADGLRRSMADALASQREQYDDQLAVIGMGSQAAERVATQIKIEREYGRFKRQLTEEAAKNGTLESEAYRTGMADIEASLQRALQANRLYYGSVDQLRSSSMLGLSQAVANYRDSAADLFGQSEALMTKALSGMEDALVNFAMTGKLSFSDMAKSVISDILRIYYRSQLLNMLGAGSGGGGGLLQTVIGAALGGAMGGFGGSSASSAYSLTTASNYSPGGLGLTYGGMRASGGPVNAGSFYQVNERGPELLSVNGRDYLMMGAQSGHVTPNASAAGSAGQGELKLTIINNTSAPIGRVTERITPTERALIVEEAVAATASQFGDPNSKTSKSLGAHYALQRRR